LARNKLSDSFSVLNQIALAERGPASLCLFDEQLPMSGQHNRKHFVKIEWINGIKE